MELKRSPALPRTRATTKLIAVAAADQSQAPTRLIDGPRGGMRRSAAVQMMAADAPRISKPSKPLEKYSALPWPKGCCAVGRIAGDEDHPQGKARPRQIDEGLQRIGQQADRPCDRPRKGLEGNGRKRCRNRQPRVVMPLEPGTEPVILSRARRR
jgi:hypothetical protein